MKKKILKGKPTKVKPEPTIHQKMRAIERIVGTRDEWREKNGFSKKPWPKLPPTISDSPNPHPISRFDLDRPEPLKLSSPFGETLAAHCETFPKFKVVYVLGWSYKSTLDITKLIRKLREARAWMRLPIPKPKKGR